MQIMKTALAVFDEMLAPFIHSGRITLLLESKVHHVETDEDDVRMVEVEHVVTKEKKQLLAPYFIDATDCGDVLPLAGAEYVTGSESQSDTGEPHALSGEADPMDMQAFTQCFGLDYVEGEDFTIEKPKDYSFWSSYQADFWPNKLLDWTAVNPVTLEANTYGFFKGEQR